MRGRREGAAPPMPMKSGAAAPGLSPSLLHPSSPSLPSSPSSSSSQPFICRAAVARGLKLPPPALLLLLGLPGLLWVLGMKPRCVPRALLAGFTAAAPAENATGELLPLPPLGLPTFPTPAAASPAAAATVAALSSASPMDSLSSASSAATLRFAAARRRLRWSAKASRRAAVHPPTAPPTITPMGKAASQASSRQAMRTRGKENAAMEETDRVPESWERGVPLISERIKSGTARRVALRAVAATARTRAADAAVFCAVEQGSAQGASAFINKAMAGLLALRGTESPTMLRALEDVGADGAVAACS